MPSFEFDLFISYATRPDYQIARQVQRFLSSFSQLPAVEARSLPTLKVCLDSSSFLSRRGGHLLSVAEMLNTHLARSRCLLVLASTGAASSTHVAQEVEWFLTHRDPASIYLAITEGDDPSAAPTRYFPPPVLDAGLEKQVWFDLRGLRPLRAWRWNKLRDAGREQVRLVAELLAAAGDTRELSADQLFPDWQDHERRRSGRRRLQWTGATALLLVVLAVAIGTNWRSKAQRELAQLREQAGQAARIVARQPEEAAALAADVWERLGALREDRGWLPGLELEFQQARLDGLRSLHTVLSAKPGWTGTLTESLSSALLTSSNDGTRLAIAALAPARSATTRSGAATAATGTSGSATTPPTAHAIELWMFDQQGTRRTAYLTWPSTIHCLDLADDGSRLVAASRRYIGVWDLSEGGEAGGARTLDLATGEASDFSCSTAEISADGSYAVLGSSDGQLMKLQLKSLALTPLAVHGFEGIVNDLAFTSDGYHLFVALWQASPALFRLRLRSGVIEQTALEGEGAPRALALSSDGSILYSGHERGVVSVRSALTGDLLWSDRLSDASISALVALPEGAVAADERGRIHLVDVQRSRRPATTSFIVSAITGVARAGSDGIAVTGPEQPLRLWHPDAPHPGEALLARDTNAGLGIARSSDDTLTAFGSEQVITWTHGKTGWEAHGQKDLSIPKGWRIITATGDGHAVALTAAYAEASPDNQIRLMRSNDETTALPGFSAKLPSGSFDTTGERLAIVDFDQSARVVIWDIRQPSVPPRHFNAPDGGGGGDLVFSADGSSIAISELRQCVHVWRLVGSPQPRSWCDPSVMPSQVAFDPTHQWIAVGSMDGAIHIFRDTPDQLAVEMTLDGHSDSISALAFDVSGRWLVSASSNGEMRVWDVVSWQTAGMIRDPDNSFVRQILASMEDASVLTLTQGGRRVSEWTLAPDRLAARAKALSQPIAPSETSRP